MVGLRNIFAAVAIASTAALFASSVSSEAAAPAVSFPHSLKIVAFGSSSTQGVGASSRKASYPAQLEMLLRRAVPNGTAVSVINAGIGGEDADDMVKRLDRDVIARHPDLVIFQTGSNDPMRHVPLDRFERETRATIAAMQTAGIEVMLMEPQWAPMLEKTKTADAYRDIVRKVGADLNLTVIRRSDLMHAWIENGTLTKAEMLASDGLHMRDKGYALLARSVASEVVRIETSKTIVSKTIVSKTIAVSGKSQSAAL